MDPQRLFSLPLDASDETMRVEERRLELVLQGSATPASMPALPSAASPPPEGAQPLSPVLIARNVPSAVSSQQSPAVDARIWDARIELDRASLAVYSLPLARRAELLRAHEARRQPATVSDHAAAISEAERVARRAEQQQRQALEAARLARTEAERLLNEEYARLLTITQRQAEFERSQLQRRTQLDARNEAVLGWRRRVSEATSKSLPDATDRARADATYVALRLTLRQARELLSRTLSASGDGVQSVPRPGPDPLLDLPAELERSAAQQERERVTAKTLELTASEEALEAAEARQLIAEIETLNRLRLELLSTLSQQKRDSVLGFAPPGWDQAASEVWQVVLTLRYHVHASYAWLAGIRDGGGRGQSAWLAFILAVKWAFPLGLFVWWRRRADEHLDGMAQRLREESRLRRDDAGLALGYAERLIVFLGRVRRPLEWLLLVGSITWLMPPAMKGLLEVRLVSSALLWILGGSLIVLATDALFSSPGQVVPSPSSGTTGTASLRLRSLHLVGRAIVAFGLALSLSDLLVGPGTIYSWVFSTCWFAAIPLLLIITAWWRPFIFERFSHMRKPNGFEQWVLSRRSPPSNVLASTLSSAAAVVGGVYLFARGALRVARNRVLTFTLTRQVLAYLFRRDLSKKARDATVPGCASLPSDSFRTLGPETASTKFVRSVADAQVQDVIARIRAAGGGAIAIVGEQGAGKTTLVERIVASGPEIVSLTCTVEGLPALRAQLNQRLGLQAGTELEAATQLIDRGGTDHGLLIDDAQYLIRPMMGGLTEFDRVLAMMRSHSKNCTWILAFDETIWRFIERTRGARPLFDDVIRLSPWNEEAIVRLITQRNERAGVKPDFSSLVLDLPANADEIDLQEAVRRIEANYYRLLWDYSTGNPGVALHFWRRSLGISDSGAVLVRLFDAPDAVHLESLTESAAFVLRAIIQLGWATSEDIGQVTSLPSDQIQDVLRFGNQLGYFDVDGLRYRVSWDWFRAVTRLLQRRHLLLASS
jgi:hypothetical protein